MRHLTRAVVAAALLAAGCGSSDELPPNPLEVDTTVAPLPFDAFMAALPAVFCAADLACYGPLAAAGGITPKETDCATFLSTSLGEDVTPTLQALIANGSVVYDPARAPLCLRALADHPCSGLVELESCIRTLAGTHLAGDPCTSTFDCAAGLVCGGASCPGACAPAPLVGEPCVDTCSTGLVCNTQLPMPTCAVPTPLGGSCGQDAAPCAEGAICVTGDAGPICASWSDCFSQGLGAFCDPDVDGVHTKCQPGLICTNNPTPGSVISSFLCVAPTAALGDACSGAAEVTGRPCPAGAYCLVDDQAEDDGVCTALPGVGAPCGVSNAGALCADGLTCDATNQLCKPYVHVGDGCSSDGDCYTGSCRGAVCARSSSCELP